MTRALSPAALVAAALLLAGCAPGLGPSAFDPTMTSQRAVAGSQAMLPAPVDYGAMMRQGAAFCAANPQELGCDQFAAQSAAQFAELRQAQAELAQARAEYEAQARP